MVPVHNLCVDCCDGHGSDGIISACFDYITRQGESALEMSVLQPGTDLSYDMIYFKKPAGCKYHFGGGIS